MGMVSALRAVGVVHPVSLLHLQCRWPSPRRSCTRRSCTRRPVVSETAVDLRASVASLSLTARNNNVSADFLKSRAMAVCGRWRASANGNTEIVGLAVNNQTVSVSGQPNQTIGLPDGTGQI
jgi:hypothetical protein